MNKKILALAITTAVCSAGVTATELYNENGKSLEMGGRAEARMSVMDGEVEDKSRVRLNFKGKVQVTNDLYGVGFYEAEYTTNEWGQGTDADSDSITNRYIYAGLGGTFGEITYVKNEGALGVITDFTDIMAYHGNSAAEKLNVADRADNMLSYVGQFNNLGLKASYRFADRGVNTSTGKYADNDADGYSLSATYSVGDTGLKVGGGYAEQYHHADEFMLGVSYEINNFYFAGLYTDGETEYKADYRGYELAASYTLDKLVFSSTYNNADLKPKGGSRGDIVDNFAIDATYYFMPNFRTYISYNFNLLDKKDVSAPIYAEDELALGLRYDF